MFLQIRGCARVCAGARVHFRSCTASRLRVTIYVHVRVFARMCDIHKSNDANSGYEYLLYESPRWKPG